MKIFYYKGYKIELFDYDYSRNKNSKWMASNENDCDEPMKISETFDEMLDKIDGLI